MDPFVTFCLRMGDNALILGQRTGEWCGHAPILEEDIAFANMGLDLIGQTQLWYGLACEAEGGARTPDDLAFLRGEREFLNTQLVEQPNTDFAHALMRQYIFDAWHLPMLDALTGSTHDGVRALAEKSVKEVRYHLERSRDLIVRLGDGSAESHARMQAALEALWPFTADLLETDAADAALRETGVLPDPAPVRAAFEAETAASLAAATLALPEARLTRRGGRQGIHSEHMGYVLAEMQSLPRAHPGAVW
ncbi:1,2-phenylacetyl-CoA epoxidase subunit PaaC [Oceanicella sp. SM1341]|uniref:1,2-phenylacetyl-CoA epoxidase subunit PaaC n=1 Tax=Oceanicella sp. SM1341 TaxID=1548889 RepID=UPI000E521FAF|nr:1,2-phenylacetyl-CoA epoxidase subunit PaaC [Oceanicella sp. SM1341]